MRKAEPRDLTSFAEKMEACQETGFDKRFLPSLIRTATMDITPQSIRAIMVKIVSDPAYKAIRIVPMVLLGLSTCASASDMTFVHVSQAKLVVQETCARLAVAGTPCAPVKLRLKESEETAPRRVDAFLTVSAGVCMITVTTNAVRDPQVVAHEACHCALDRTDVGARGWLISDPAEITARESRARACAARMVR